MDAVRACKEGTFDLVIIGHSIPAQPTSLDQKRIHHLNKPINTNIRPPLLKSMKHESKPMSSRYMYMLLAVLTLAVAFALAQGAPSTQGQPDQTQQTPQTQQPSSSQDLQTQMQAAFQKEPGLSNVTVSVTDDKIELSGTVASKADKDKARSTAESHAGARKVVDNIKVSK